MIACGANRTSRNHEGNKHKFTLIFMIRSAPRDVLVFSGRRADDGVEAHGFIVKTTIRAMPVSIRRIPLRLRSGRSSSGLLTRPKPQRGPVYPFRQIEKNRGGPEPLDKDLRGAPAIKPDHRHVELKPAFDLLFHQNAVKPREPAEPIRPTGVPRHRRSPFHPAPGRLAPDRRRDHFTTG